MAKDIRNNAEKVWGIDLIQVEYYDTGIMWKKIWDMVYQFTQRD